MFFSKSIIKLPSKLYFIDAVGVIILLEEIESELEKISLFSVIPLDTIIFCPTLFCDKIFVFVLFVDFI